MEAAELRSKTPDELRTELHDLLREQFNLRMQQGSGQLARHHAMKDVRRNIARVMTVMNEQKRAGA